MMAETTIKKPRVRKSANTKSKAANVAESLDNVTTNAEGAANASPSTSPKRRAKVALPLDTLICCVSGVADGILRYESTRLNGCTFEWQKFGDEQYIELSELQALRNVYPSFFEKNWLLIDDKEALEFLHVEQCYKYIYNVDDFYKVFSYTPDQIRHIVPQLSEGLKHSIAHIAVQMIASGELDSNARIKALEDTTGFQLQRL